MGGSCVLGGDKNAEDVGQGGCTRKRTADFIVQFARQAGCSRSVGSRGTWLWDDYKPMIIERRMESSCERAVRIREFRYGP